MAVSETRFEALGRSWHFKFGIAAICRLEQVYDLPIARVMQQIMPNLSPAELADPVKVALARMDIRVTDSLRVLHAGLVEDATSEEAAEIMDELGLEQIELLLAQAFSGDIAERKGRGRQKKAGAPPSA